MAKMTITEALAEVKLIEKKVKKKVDFVLQNLTRYEHQDDPFAKDGGATKALTAEIQSVDDLNSRIEKIRSAIATANLNHQITVGEKTRSIHEWLTWKREVSANYQNFVSAIASGLKQRIDLDAQKPALFKTESGEVKLSKLITHLDYPDFSKRSEMVMSLIEQLDGQLSLKNATIVVDI